MVQPELHLADEGREGDGNPGEPHADAAAPRVPEAVDGPPSDALALQLEPEPDGEAVGAAALRPDESVGFAVATPPDVVAEPLSLAAGGQAGVHPPDLRLTSPGIRLAQVQEELVAWVKTLLSAAVYAVLIVTFGFQVARVEGQSMAPTLEDQDRLIVNKLVYRIGEPRRGDIVMLYYPLNPDKSFVKRVIAEEGDTVRIIDGRVYVNDIPLQDDYVKPDFRSHDDWGPQVIPEGYDFVMGDNRNNSSDSRSWGMVPKKYIIGKVQIRWWPVPTARIF